MDPPSEYTVNHVFLPPCLPQQSDISDEDLSPDFYLAQDVLTSARNYVDIVSSNGQEASPQWSAALAMLSSIVTLSKEPYSAKTVQDLLLSMQDGASLAFLVRKQNAGLILRIAEDKVFAEAFRVSLPNEVVQASEGKILRTFPEVTISFDRTYLENEEFCSQLGSVLAQMNVDEMDESSSHTRKAGNSLLEIRNPASPHLITDWLLGVLCALDGQFDAPRCLVTKRIADEVLWKDAYLPWRRSSLWLVIRVALQTMLDGSNYKSFMVYFLSNLLERAAQYGWDADRLSFMQSKVTRRAVKLEAVHGLSNYLEVQVLNVNERTNEVMEHNWANVRNQLNESAGSQDWAPSSLNLERDARVRLSSSFPYISSVLNRPRGTSELSTFHPTHPVRTFQTEDLMSIMTHASTYFQRAGDDLHLDLLDFEDRVRDDLQSWITSHASSSTKAVALIKSLIFEYHKAACGVYRDNALSMSRMVLTILDLWVALDSCAVEHCSLLAEYPPELTATLLEPLLVRQSSDLARVARIARYLHGRVRNATKPSIFCSTGLESFSTQYFRQSRVMQEHKAAIEQRAEKERSDKLRELEQKNDQYSRWTSEAARVGHDHPWVERSRRRGGGYYDESRCRKCNLVEKYNALFVSLHEWPLPRDTIAAESAVFELNLPIAFAYWREVVYMILHDMLSVSPPEDTTKTHSRLLPYMSGRGLASSLIPSRLTVASTTKSFPKTHYNGQKNGKKGRKVPVHSDQVCVDHGLNWTLFDTKTSRVVPSGYHSADVASLCTLRLPRGELYDGLSFAVEDVTHTSNEVLAKQSLCPPDLSLHEFHSFATIRSGENVQWPNLLDELAMDTLTFSRQQVHTLISQTVWQIGKVDAAGRLLWHEELGSPTFLNKLLTELERIHARIGNNWQEAVTLKSLIALTTRILGTVTISGEIITRSLTFLRCVRQTLYTWLQSLAARTDVCAHYDGNSSNRVRLLEIAAICRQTYGFNVADMARLLSTPEDLSTYLHCAIAIHNNLPSSPYSASSPMGVLLSEDFRLAHDVEPLIRAKCLEFLPAIDTAIAKVWPSFEPAANSWKAMHDLSERWLTGQTAAEEDRVSQTVHLNVLSGKLLVDGRTLGVLPTSLTSHDIYTRLFGQTVLSVVPSDIAGMDYKTSSLVHGHVVYFGSRNSKLVVQARLHWNPDFVEYIPHHHFEADVPQLFSSGFAHWLNVRRRAVEFRPLTDLWKTSPRNWHINLNGPAPFTLSNQYGDKLVDRDTPTFRMLYSRLRALEPHWQHVVMQFHPFAEHRILVELPRHRLSFRLDKKHQTLRCVNFSNTIVDANQNIEALHGLQTKLVLRNINSHRVSPKAQRVIIPIGDVVHNLASGHVSVTIDINPAVHDKVLYHVYVIDQELSCLVGDGTLEARLFKIYLHAVTSHLVPDVLTGRTGMEEALNELHSAACMSFQSLNTKQLELLRAISSLTPQREFYPPNLRSMQTVHWDSSLSPSTQSPKFKSRVDEILSYDHRLSIFGNIGERGDLDAASHESSEGLYPLHFRSLLQHTAAYPAMVFTQTKAEALPNDLLYTSRDAFFSNSALEVRTSKHHHVARMVASLTPSSYCMPLNDLFESLKSLGEVSKQHPDLEFLSYRRYWFETMEMSNQWLPLYESCMLPVPLQQKQFRVLFSLSACLYHGNTGQDHCLTESIPLLVALIRRPEDFPDAPRWLDYKLASGLQPSSQAIHTIIERHSLPVSRTPSNRISRRRQETNDDWEDRCFDHHSVIVAAGKDFLLSQFLSLWKTGSFHCITFPTSVNTVGYFDVSPLLSDVKELFSVCVHNRDLHAFIKNIENKLRPSLTSVLFLPATLLANALTDVHLQPLLPRSFPSFIDTANDIVCVFRHPTKVAESRETWDNSGSNVNVLVRDVAYRSDAAIQLQDLLRRFSQSKHSLHCLYADHMFASLSQLVKDAESRHDIVGRHAQLDSQADYNHCQRQFDSLLELIRQALCPRSPRERLLASARRFPSFTVREILFQMTVGHWSKISMEWRRVITIFALALLDLQHSRRVLESSFRSRDSNKNVRNDSRISLENAMRNPEWVLIQIEQDITTRPVQLRVASEMCNPTSGKNTALQLNMGEGKSYVIVPSVACSLANGRDLLRVVVLKPLARQMFQLLVDRISGLPNRRVAFFPFSRQTKIKSSEDMHRVMSLYEDCSNVGGVLVAQPEHILSAKLLSVDRILHMASPRGLDLAKKALSLHRWLSARARDVLDESDEELHVRYQLIYTIGIQHEVCGGSMRWTTLQHLLALAALVFEEMIIRHQRIILITPRPWVFPSVQLRTDDLASVSSEFRTIIVEKIMDHGVPGLNPAYLGEVVSSALKDFLTSSSPNPSTIKVIKSLETSLRSLILIVRGSITKDILFYVNCHRRYRVDYGLDTSRSLLAVPFRAKDVPAPRAEFGHSDIVILLTCLAYYHQGLTAEQLMHCFLRLLKLSNPAEQYSEWTSIIPKETLPKAVRSINGVNMEDHEQFNDVLLHLFSRNFLTINFYLCQFVFPKAAKEFPYKLPTSGWDLAEERANPTTGFSGTNDNRFLLPLTIQQSDPVGQAGTNALVLTHLLHPTNNIYRVMEDSSGFTLDGRGFIRFINELSKEIFRQSARNVHVLLDVGAQILDLQNKEVVIFWMELYRRPEAGVYFDENDELSVVTRDGTVEPFISSSYRDQTNKCLLYLDDAHTRGTDVRLPSDAVAAVTLGKKVTKDRLVQGCMRMRQLGSGQSLIFFAPPEVDGAIRRAVGKGKADVVTVEDIIRWSMLETCRDIEKHAPAWAAQAKDYWARRDSLESFSETDLEMKNVERLQDAWMQKEAKTLEELYIPTDAAGKGETQVLAPEIEQRLRLLGMEKVVDDVCMDEEQEREVFHEVEEERDPERPEASKPLPHHVAQALRSFVNTGNFVAGSPAFVTLEDILECVPSWAPHRQRAPFAFGKEQILATKDFARTVEDTAKLTRQQREATEMANSPREFLKPVRYILSRSNTAGTMQLPLLLISQYEANKLIGRIRRSTAVRMHVYAPRTTPAMPPFDDLSFYTIPPSSNPPVLDKKVKIQLNLFAGQLYPSSYSDYVELCRFLGVDVTGKMRAQRDGFVLRKNRRGVEGQAIDQCCPFETSPVPFVKEWMGLRRKDQTFDKSPIGRLLDGRVMRESEFVRMFVP